MGLSIPLLPGSIRASSLLHGSDADFVTNAYLALQHQWPDDGGFAHYVYSLGQGARRVDILREIAQSPNARQCGVHFIDDLPPGYEYQPQDQDGHALLETSLTLRVARTAADVEHVRLAMSRLTADELATAVEGLVQAQLLHQAVLESQSRETSVSVSALQAEVTELRLEVQRLRAYTHVELKRQVADYVNALSTATDGAVPLALPARDAARGRTNVRSIDPAQSRRTAVRRPARPALTLRRPR